MRVTDEWGIEYKLEGLAIDLIIEGKRFHVWLEDYRPLFKEIKECKNEKPKDSS